MSWIKLKIKKGNKGFSLNKIIKKYNSFKTDFNIKKES